jgi:hypothetical protein
MAAFSTLSKGKKTRFSIPLLNASSCMKSRSCHTIGQLRKFLGASGAVIAEARRRTVHRVIKFDAEYFLMVCQMCHQSSPHMVSSTKYRACQAPRLYLTMPLWLLVGGAIRLFRLQRIEKAWSLSPRTRATVATRSVSALPTTRNMVPTRPFPSPSPRRHRLPKAPGSRLSSSLCVFASFSPPWSCCPSPRHSLPSRMSYELPNLSGSVLRTLSRLPRSSR